MGVLDSSLFSVVGDFLWHIGSIGWSGWVKLGLFFLKLDQFFLEIQWIWILLADLVVSIVFLLLARTFFSELFLIPGWQDWFLDLVTWCHDWLLVWNDMTNFEV